MCVYTIFKGEYREPLIKSPGAARKKDNIFSKFKDSSTYHGSREQREERRKKKEKSPKNGKREEGRRERPNFQLSCLLGMTEREQRGRERKKLKKESRRTEEEEGP